MILDIPVVVDFILLWICGLLDFSCGYLFFFSCFLFFACEFSPKWLSVCYFLN